MSVIRGSFITTPLPAVALGTAEAAGALVGDVSAFWGVQAEMLSVRSEIASRIDTPDFIDCSMIHITFLWRGNTCNAGSQFVRCDFIHCGFCRSKAVKPIAPCLRWGLICLELLEQFLRVFSHQDHGAV